MSSTKLYFLFFKRNCCGEYDVFASRALEDGRLSSDEYISTCIPGQVEKFVEEFHKSLKDGKVENFEVDYIEVKR